MGDGPEQVRQACEAAVAALVAAMPVSGVAGSRAEWAAAVGAVQQVLNVAAGVQDAAIARLAAIEPEWVEDGTQVESHRALGHAALDAPAILSGVLNVAPVHAERRTLAAVRLAADGPTGSATSTGLGGLHAAMTAGVLDPYRAGVVADELEYAPAQVAASVVTALTPHFGSEDGAHLRRRCRRVLARVSPDLLLQRAKRARAQCGLRRYATEPGIDRWEGTFPSEDAAKAWAAIDALAQQHVTDGTCTHIEQARGKALTDLVTSTATIEAVITLTVPATITTPAAVAAEVAGVRPDRAAGGTHGAAEVAAVHAAGAGPAGTEPAVARDSDLVEVTGLTGNQPVLVPRGWVSTTIDTQRGTDPRKVTTAACHPATGALLDTNLPAAPPVTGREPTTAPDPDVDPATKTGPPPDENPHHRPAHADAPQRRGYDATTGRSSDAVEGANDGGEGGDGGQAHTEKGASPADPDVHAATATAAQFGPGTYRPSPRLARMIRARDRRCRFPGCTIAAVFCDLDHVQPWPTGPTTATNLICLCRRHHRTKQRPGWHLTLHPDGTTTWTDPTGARRTAAPVDALTPTVLPDTDLPDTDLPATALPDTCPTSQARVVLHDGPHSDLEFTLEHLTAGQPWTSTTAWRDSDGRRHRVERLQITDAQTYAPPRNLHPNAHHHPWFRNPTHHRHRPRHPDNRASPRHREHDHDPPPF